MAVLRQLVRFSGPAVRIDRTIRKRPVEKAVPARIVVVKPPANSSRVIQHRQTMQNMKSAGL